jgi:DUF1680 family protein
LDGPFKKAQDLNIEYLLSINPDRLLSPFLREAGLAPKAQSYTNWESSGLDGHIGGHYLSALSYMYASTGDSRIGERLEYMIQELKRVQDKNGNGYIGGVPKSEEVWSQIANGNIDAKRFRLNTRWVPLYNIHKTYAGLRDAWLYTGNQTARDMLIKLTDWMIDEVSELSDEQIQEMLISEHGGLNETFADVAAITGDDKYLKLAHQFSHKEILSPLLVEKDSLTGLHANTQIPKVLGYKRIADVENNKQWNKAASFFWERVVNNRSVSIGGNSVREHFNPIEDFSLMLSSEQGPETCNTYNMLRLTMMLNATSPNGKYSDYYEQALYNHILSTQNPNTGGLVYFTPMRPAHYRVYSQTQTSMWCCVGSGMENHSKYGEMIYAHKGNQLYVNLFIPSSLDWKEQGVNIIQTNKYPDEPRTTLIINSETPVDFELKIRYPKWTKNMGITVNGDQIPVKRGKDGYVSIKREWKKGDEVIAEFPMNIEVSGLPDKSNFVSISYGPVVLASRWGSENMTGLFADDSRGGHIARGPQISFSNIPYVNIENMDIKPLGDGKLHFTMNSSQGLVNLEPFYEIHESRYIIYWPTIQMKNESEESLKALTLDVVYCGQQQPESDHGIQLEKSQTGYTNNLHWRDASGWFSYQMKNTDKLGVSLQIAYLNAKEKRKFLVYINDVVIQTIATEGGGNNELLLLKIPFPKRIGDNFVVKISADEKMNTAPIVEVRLLKSDKK